LNASVLEVARTMREHGVSSILLVQEGQLMGLVTDRDLRNKVVAESLELSLPAADIASLNSMTLDQRSPAFEALPLMTRHKIHHVPVMVGQRLVSRVTATDLARQQSTSPLYLTRDIHRHNTLEGLVGIGQQVRALQNDLSAAKTSAHNTGHIITAITDALTCRLIALTEADLGPHPCPMSGWLQARKGGANKPPSRTKTIAWFWTTPMSPACTATISRPWLSGSATAWQHAAMSTARVR
jgi:CBS domain-containing protein